MDTLTLTNLTLDTLLSQDWIKDELEGSYISYTTDGEAILWTMKEAYRVNGRNITRLFIPKTEPVLL